MGVYGKRFLATAAGCLLALSTGGQASMAASSPRESVTYQIDSSRSGGQPGDSLTPPLVRKWSMDFGSPISYPLIAGGEIFVNVRQASPGQPPVYASGLYAFDASSGARLWGPVQVSPDAPGWIAIAYDNTGGLGRVFGITTQNQTGIISAFNALSGAPLWQTSEPNGQAFGGTPLPVNGTLFVQPGFSEQAINELDGRIEWTVASEGPDAATPGGVYTAGYCGNIRDVSPATGATIWSTPSSCWNTLQGYPVVSGGRLYNLGASQGQYLPTIYDASSGAILGHFKADMSPVFDGSVGIFVDRSTVSAQDMRTGAALWSFTGDCDIYTLPVAANGYVYIASAQGNLYALNERTGKLAWSDNTGARIVGEGQSPNYPSPAASSPALAIGEGLLAVPAGSRLIVYTSDTAGTPWKPAPISAQGPSGFERHLIPNPTGAVPPPAPSAITVGADGNLWFIEGRRNRIAKMTPAGAVTEYDIPSAQSWPTAITSGPDGAVWFTEQNTYKIGRITSDGTITEFPTPVDRGDNPPSAPAGPYGITSGPDGALWFTNYYGAEIDRMTVSGVTTVHQIPMGTGPMNLTFGPDGNLWFTQYHSIGRMAPDGSGYANFDIPDYQMMHELTGQIVTGPDGNLWFTEGGTYDPPHATAGTMGGIGRITPAGVITDFQTPTPASAPVGIVAGPDGALWFTQYNMYFDPPSKIGRITTDGAFSDYWIPGGVFGPHPYGITRTSDGGLWFAESSANAITRLDVSAPPCPAPAASASTIPARLPSPERLPAAPPAAASSATPRAAPPPPVPQDTSPPATASQKQGRDVARPARVGLVSTVRQADIGLSPAGATPERRSWLGVFWVALRHLLAAPG